MSERVGSLWRREPACTCKQEKNKTHHFLYLQQQFLLFFLFLEFSGFTGEILVKSFGFTASVAVVVWGVSAVLWLFPYTEKQTVVEVTDNKWIQAST